MPLLYAHVNDLSAFGNRSRVGGKFPESVCRGDWWSPIIMSQK